MARLTPAEAIKRYKRKRRPDALLEYNPVEHQDHMEDLMTGLAGAVYSLRLPSLFGPEIGSPIPAMVLDVPGDVMRLFVDPTFLKVKEKPRRVIFSAFTYKGEYEVYDTERMILVNKEGVIDELLRIKEVADLVRQATGTKVAVLAPRQLDLLS